MVAVVDFDLSPPSASTQMASSCRLGPDVVAYVADMTEGERLWDCYRSQVLEDDHKPRIGGAAGCRDLRMAEAAGWVGDYCVDRGFAGEVVKLVVVVHKRMVEARFEADSEAEACGILQLLDLDRQQHEFESYLVVLACSICLDLATVDLLAGDNLQQ